MDPHQQHCSPSQHEAPVVALVGHHGRLGVQLQRPAQPEGELDGLEEALAAAGGAEEEDDQGHGEHLLVGGQLAGVAGALG